MLSWPALLQLALPSWGLPEARLMARSSRPQPLPWGLSADYRARTKESGSVGSWAARGTLQSGLACGRELGAPGVTLVAIGSSVFPQAR